MRIALIVLLAAILSAQQGTVTPTGTRSIDPQQTVLNRDLSEPGARGRSAKAAALIEQAERDWAAAVSRNDFARLEQILAPGLIYTHSTGLVEDRANFIDALRSGRQKYDSIEHLEMVVRVRGNTAMAAAKVRMTGNSQGKPFDNMLRFLHVWVKTRNGWQLVGHQSARLP